MQELNFKNSNIPAVIDQAVLVTSPEQNNNLHDSSVIIHIQETQGSAPLADSKNLKRILPNTNASRVYWAAKIIVSSIILGVVWLGKTYATPSIQVDHLKDPIHEQTQYLNDLVLHNRIISMAFQIATSIIMDVSFFALLIYWAIRIKSCRVMFALACFYIFRGINQALIIFPFPQGYYWENPSFPSYVTPYGKTSDFFYSGHVGFLNILALEWLAQKQFFMFKLTCAFNVFVAFVMLVFRIHYAVDITTGLVVSHWIFLLTQKHITSIDNLVMFLYNSLEKQFQKKSLLKTENEEELSISP